MKKIYAIFLSVLLTTSLFAQSPQKMSYQAVIRNNSDQLVTNHAIGMQISILQGSSSGTAVYVETQTPTTNANGLVSIEIGGGTVVTGTFAGIDWSTGTYYIKTETDPTGGTGYTITGTSQLLSVPYALHAKTVASYPETDPIFGAWNKSTGISITASQVSDFQTSVTNNAAVLLNTAKNSYPSADQTKLAAITGTNTGDETATTIKDKLGITTLSGSNTGDQTLSGLGGVASNTPITGATKTKITYDAKGLVTAGTDATTDDIAASLDKNYVTDAQLTVIENTSGINTGDYTHPTGDGNLHVPATGTTNNGKVLTAGATAGSLSWETPTTGGGVRYLGEEYDGGIIFNIYKGSDGQEHGLIVALTESTAKWQNTGTLVDANRSWDGLYNTNLMTDSPARTYVESLGAGWYLPSVDELIMLWHNRFYVNKAMNDGGYTLLSSTAEYWSSTENNESSAWAFAFLTGNTGNGYNKGNSNYVRAIRAF
jgi:hypothetical protein